MHGRGRPRRPRGAWPGCSSCRPQPRGRCSSAGRCGTSRSCASWRRGSVTGATTTTRSDPYWRADQRRRPRRPRSTCRSCTSPAGTTTSPRAASTRYTTMARSGRDRGDAPEPAPRRRPVEPQRRCRSVPTPTRRVELFFDFSPDSPSMRFFAHHLKGELPDYDDEPPVRIYVMGENVLARRARVAAGPDGVDVLLPPRATATPVDGRRRRTSRRTPSSTTRPTRSRARSPSARPTTTPSTSTPWPPAPTCSSTRTAPLGRRHRDHRPGDRRAVGLVIGAEHRLHGQAHRGLRRRQRRAALPGHRPHRRRCRHGRGRRARPTATRSTSWRRASSSRPATACGSTCRRASTRPTT